MSQTKEFRVSGDENTKRLMYLVKEFLLNRDVIDLVSGTQGAPVTSKVSDALVRLGYVTYVDIRTETYIFEERRKTKLVVRLAKAPEFNKLYEENEAKRKQFQDQREEANKN
jgi:hypothetical protein